MTTTVPDRLDERFFEVVRALFGERGHSDLKAVQVTSSRFSEGATTLTLALARFMAKTFGPDKVLAVEANVRQPSFVDLLGLDPGRSLAGVLAKRQKVEEAIQQMDEPGFSALPGGPAGKADIEAWEQALFRRFPEVVAELKESYEHILIDSPPVIPYVDASLISGYVDGVVIVVEAGVTPSEVLDHSIEKLKEAGATVLGMILNKRDYHIPKWMYRLL